MTTQSSLQTGLGALAALTLVTAALHCKGSDPPLTDLGSGGGAQSGASSASSTSGASSGHGGHVASSSASSGSGGAGGTLAPPLCDPAKAWKAGVAVAGLAQDLAAAAFAITDDERTAAWIVLSPTVALWVADREKATDPFGAAQHVTAADGYLGADGVSVSPDGLRVVVVRSDAKAFAEAVRPSKADAFGAPDETAFALLNQATDTGMAYSKLGDPVVSGDDTTLIFSGYGLGGTTSVYEAYRNMPLAPWPSPAPRGSGPVEVVNGARRHPTGLSSDLRTLFLWDDLAPGAGREAIRAKAGEEFTMSLALGDEHGLHANAACDRLYFLVNGAPRVASAQ